VRPVLVEPEAGACRAARMLFDSPVLRASATALPFRDQTFDASWSLGVLCTMSDQLDLLTELRRVTTARGSIGLLVFVARTTAPFEQPDGNHFPTEDELLELLDDAGLVIHARRGTSEVNSAPPQWQSRLETVTTRLAQRHGHQHAWQLANEQADLIGRLLDESVVTGELVAVRRA
jgi:SAM-dependent methyltransferase